MIDQEDNTNLGECVLDDNNQVGLFGTNLFQIFNLVLSQLLMILLIIFGCFWRIHLSKICGESTVWLGIVCNAAGYVLFSPRI